MTELIKTEGGFSPIGRPHLAPDLEGEVALIVGGPRRYAARITQPNEDGFVDPGFVLAPVEPEYHPDAERAAVQLRAARSHRVDLDTIREWLDALLIAIPNAPQNPDKVGMLATIIAKACSDIPLTVWASQDALADAILSFKFFPSVAELHDLLKRHDDRELAELAALDRIAKAAPGYRRGPARASTVPYDPGGAPEWCFKRTTRASSDPLDPEERARDWVRIDPVRVDAQLVALGYASRADVPPLEPREPKR